jgi:glycosyltransferase involved in cell wall biosynthesis
MSKPKISVLMPVYNAAKFLNESIESILNQTFFEFEFIIIDDGSTDQSVDIIKEFNDPRIVLLRNERNLGISETLNKGILLAKSELIARMDADDISHPSRLQKQYDYMMRNPDCALLSSWARVVSEDLKFVRLERYRSKFYYYNLIFECWMYHPTIMFRKKEVQEVGMYSMPYSEDFDLFWKMSRKFKIGNIPEALVDYRLSSTSLNVVLKKDEYEEANKRNVLRNIRHYLGDDLEISDTVMECLRHNFDPILKDFDSFESCLTILDKITKRLLEEPNPNRNNKDILDAHYYKRQFIIREVARRLPRQKMIQLLAHTRGWQPLYELISNGVQWRMKNIMRSFSH